MKNLAIAITLLLASGCGPKFEPEAKTAIPPEAIAVVAESKLSGSTSVYLVTDRHGIEYLIVDGSYKAAIVKTGRIIK